MLIVFAKHFRKGQRFELFGTLERVLQFLLTETTLSDQLKLSACGVGYEDLLVASKLKEKDLWLGPFTALMACYERSNFLLIMFQRVRCVFSAPAVCSKHTPWRPFSQTALAWFYLE